jgi:hypothetical protein
MSGLVIVSLLAAAMMTMIWIALGRKSQARRPELRLPGQLSAAERRRLYQRLGIDPAELARRRHSNVIWLDPRVIDRRRTDA